MTIIDSHCHAGYGDGLTGPWDTNAELTRFMKWSIEAGIDKTVLFAPFHSDYSHANRKVAEIVNKHPGRFYGYAFVNSQKDKRRIFEMVRTAITAYNFCGIKCHRYDSRITREVCEAGRYFSIPVLYDPMGDVPGVELIASEYPDVTFIIPHLSSFADDWKAQQSFIDKLVKHKNVYTDTSGVRRFDLLKEAYERAGPGKILFGTDGPWLHPLVEITKVYALGLSEVENKMILGENFTRLVLKRHKQKQFVPDKAKMNL